MKVFHFSILILLLLTAQREAALEIGIGIGIGTPPQQEDCPPPPPPPECPPPPPPPECPPPPTPPPPSFPPPLSSPPPPIPPRKPPPSPPSPLPIELQMAIRVIQRFKSRITGDPNNVTKTWIGNDICKDSSKYIGFGCNRSPIDGKLRVAAVQFNLFKLSGKSLYLNGFIEQLKYLVVFHANSNFFLGTIPNQISQIPTFYELDLSNNKLTGGFPRAVLGATNLTFLDIRYNGLTGNVPSQVFNLDLEALFLNNNYFTGEIPGNIGNSPVFFLTLANNKFTGQIPKYIGKASYRLREVLLLNNQLSGCLPYEIGLLKKATVFDASINLLTGPIPHSFGCLANIQQLNFAYNRLYGEVPENLCKLGDSGDLLKLNFHSNYITEVGPECRKLISKKILDVSKNCIIDLPDQRNPTECKKFFSTQATCPDVESFNYVPCDVARSSSKKRNGRILKSEAALTTVYAALIQHRW